MVEITYQMVLSTLQTIALIVGIVYYLTIMRNTQRSQKQAEETRKVQLLMQVFHSQDVDYALRRTEVANMEFSDYDDFQEKMEGMTWAKVATTWAEWNQLGLLLKNGFIDPDTMFEFLSGRGPIIHWNKYESIIKEYRYRRKWYSVGVGFEYLAKEMEKYRDKQEQHIYGEHPELRT
jgi:hypothetical protein